MTAKIILIIKFVMLGSRRIFLDDFSFFFILIMNVTTKRDTIEYASQNLKDFWVISDDVRVQSLLKSELCQQSVMCKVLSPPTVIHRNKQQILAFSQSGSQGHHTSSEFFLYYWMNPVIKSKSSMEGAIFDFPVDAGSGVLMDHR